MSNTTLSVAPPEYVITRKLEFYREGGSSKHLADIRGMLRHARDEIDMSMLTSFIAERGLGRQWAEVGDVTPELG